MPALGLAEEPIPLWWTTDFILASPEGTPAEEDMVAVNDYAKKLGDVALSILGGASAAAAPAASAPAADAPAASGLIDVSALTKIGKDDLGLLPQPAAPKFKGAVVQIYVRAQPYGGADKSSNGHRYDSVPFANGMIMAGMSCQLIHYTHEEHDKFFEVAAKFDFLIVRCNPGQIKADGGDQAKFDDG